MSLLAKSASAMIPLDQLVEVLAPALVTNPHLTGEKSLSWSTATVAASVAGRLVPASTRALERVSRVGKVGVYELFTAPVALTPLGRVRIGAVQYAVLDARAYRTRTHAIVEEVNT